MLKVSIIKIHAILSVTTGATSGGIQQTFVPNDDFLLNIVKCRLIGGLSLI